LERIVLAELFERPDIKAEAPQYGAYVIEADDDATDAALRKAVHPQPLERYEALSEFVYDLRHPNAELQRSAPIVARSPVAFWRTACAVLGALVFLLLLLHFGLPKS
jgi:hypothetical protein